MGRKIPAKKHRGVKDPLEQQARRLQSVKDKINAPPADPDEQPVPRSLLRLFAPRAAPGAALPRRPRRDPRTTQHDQGRRDNPVARLRALAGEDGRQFSRRISAAVRALHEPALRYPADDDDDEEEDRRGARMAELRARRARKQRRSAARTPASPALAPAAPALTRTQKLALKRKAKKDKAKEEAASRELQYERVPFGSVAHAPPALRPPRRAAPAAAAAPRPGRRPLLLTALLAAPGGAAGGAAAGGADEARAAAVAAYRALKAVRRRRR